MSAEAQVVPVAPAIPTEAPAAAPAVPTEAKVETIVGEVVGKVEAAVKAVEAAGQEAANKAVQFATEARVEITADEKVLVTRLENEFLRATNEIQRLQKITENAQKQFPVIVEQLVKKYAINPATHVFDNIELAFKKK